MRVFEIEDENGNKHGPFETKEQAFEAAAYRGLGEERDADDKSGIGWTWCCTRSN